MVRSLMVLALVATAGFSLGAGGLSPPAPPGQEKKDEKKTDDYAKLIVGKWEITKAGGGAPAGTVIEFDKDKKVVMTIDLAGKKQTVEGTYTIEKDKLTAKMKFGDQTNEETLTIKKLTADALELEDAKGGVDVLKKVK